MTKRFRDVPNPTHGNIENLNPEVETASEMETREITPEIIAIDKKLPFSWEQFEKKHPRAEFLVVAYPEIAPTYRKGTGCLLRTIRPDGGTPKRQFPTEWAKRYMNGDPTFKEEFPQITEVSSNLETIGVTNEAAAIRLAEMLMKEPASESETAN